MTTSEVSVPDIGDFDAVDVIDIVASVGNWIEANDPLITVETDKASMDIPAPQAGRVVEFRVSIGDRVSEGDVIAVIEIQGDNQSAEPVVSEPPANHLNEQSKRPIEKPFPHPPLAPATSARRSAAQVHASPSTRRMARELGVDLSKVSGTGRKNRITTADVQTFIREALSGAARTETETAIPAIPKIDFSQFGAIETLPLTRIQRISGPHLHRSWLNVPMVTQFDTADITELEAFRQELKPEAEKRGIRVTALGFIMLAVSRALREFPRLNASLAADQQSLILKRYCHLGVAVDTANGLIVPVLRDVDQLTLFELSAQLAELSARARAGKLCAADLQGGCFSVSSLGGIGGTGFTPIINAPEVAILGVSRARMQPHWNGSHFEPRLMLPLALTFDHRVIDGALAARFTVFLSTLLNDFRRISL